MIENARTKVFWLMVVLTVAFAVLTVVHSVWWVIGVVIAGVLVLVGLWDLLQSKHSLLRNYPIVGHMPASSSRMPVPSCTSTSSRTTPTVGRSIATPAR